MKAAIAAAIHGELAVPFKSPPNAFDLDGAAAAQQPSILVSYKSGCPRPTDKQLLQEHEAGK